MTFNEVQAAWKQSQGPDFYNTFQGVTGISKESLEQHFHDWGLLPMAEIRTIAEQCGTTVQEGGFHAYLALFHTPSSTDLDP